MQSFEQFVSQHVPWFWGFLAWSVVILLFLTVASIPAYLILYPIASRVRREIGSYLAQLFSGHAAAREGRKQSLGTLVEDFRSNSGLSCVSEPTKGFESALWSFTRIHKTARPRLKSIEGLLPAFKRYGDRLTEAVSKSPAMPPEIPACEQIASQDAGLRIAWVHLIVSSLLLIAMMTVNTGMLGQILRELIVHDLSYFGVPLYLAFALLLTIAEAGVGCWHATTRPKAGEPPKAPVGQVVTICICIVMACVEGFFYSQVAPSKDSFVDLPIGYQLKQGKLFFLWGVVLVSVLFGLGGVWLTSLERIASSSNHLPSLLRRLSRHRERFATACEKTARSASDLTQKVEAAGRHLESASREAIAVADSADRLGDAARQRAPDAVPARLLTSAEAYHFIHLSGLWFVLTTVTAVIVTASGFFAVRYTFPSLAIAACVFVSIGLAVYFVVLGLLLPRGEFFLDGSGTTRAIVSGSPWRAKTIIVLAVAMIVAIVALAWRVGVTSYQAVLWLVILVLGGALAGACSQATASGKGLRPWLHSCAHLLLCCLEAGVRTVWRLVFGVSYGVEVLALALAAPVYLLRGRDLPAMQVTPNDGTGTSSPRLAA